MAGLPFGPVVDDYAEGEGGTGGSGGSCPYSKRAAYAADYLPTTNITQFVSRGCNMAPPPANGESADGVTWFESEPNDSIFETDEVVLGTGPGEENSILIYGTVGTGDLDVNHMTLRGGDILSVNLTGGGGDLSLQDAQGNEYIGAQSDTNAIFSNALSPFPRGGSVSITYVIPQDGDYYLQIASGITSASANYIADLRVYRPVLEDEAVGTHQILYLDFNGAVVDSGIYGAPGGVSRLSPLKNFLAGWGLALDNENEVIDAIVARVKHNYDYIRAAGLNGDYFATGNIGDFDLEIQNSRDNPDPWGKPNVTRVIVGGSQIELGIQGIYGIAQSVDVGNFDTTETAVSLLDTWSDIPANPASANSVVLGLGRTRIEVIGRLVGDTTSHEAAHMFGAAHSDGLNLVRNIMDVPGGTADDRAGVGPDGIYGTIDDLEDRRFNNDAYSAPFTGQDDTTNELAWALATGRIPTAVTGEKWLDINGNGQHDGGEHGLEGWVIYSDENRNGLVDEREPQAVTDADGQYTLYVPAGNRNITEYLAPKWEQTYPRTNVNPNGVGYHNISVGVGQTITGINFGNRPQVNTIKGVKWNDANQDGVRQNLEKGIPNFTIYIDLDGDGAIDIGEPADVTDQYGQYEINTFESGTYQLREIQQPGYSQTFPANGQTHTVILNGGTLLTNINYGNIGQALDFGDAPTNYPVLLANNGARAPILKGLYLGTPVIPVGNALPGIEPDAEVDGQPDANAQGDDAALNDDEDGILFPTAMVVGTTATISVSVTTDTNPAGYLNGWIDFNGDGDWDDSGEQVIRARSLVEGTSLVSFAIPTSVGLANDTFARFRYDLNPNVGPTGLGIAGEVEDYKVTILNDEPRAVDDNFTVNQNSQNQILDVLANDIRSSAGELSFVLPLGATSNNGSVQVDDRGTPNNSADDVIRYTPVFGFVGVESFTYTVRDPNGRTSSAIVTVNVVSSIVDPVAVDDSFNIELLPGTAVFNVMANDLPGQNGPISLLSVSSPATNQGVAIKQGNNVQYTLKPNSVAGDEQFTYTIQDSSTPIPKTSTATVTVHIGGSMTGDLVQYILQATDLNNNPVISVNPGQQFYLQVFVDDLRTDDGDGDGNPTNNLSVFAAYFDLLYSSQLVSLAGTFEYAPFPQDVPDLDGTFRNQKSGDTTIPGLINELGGFQDNPPLRGPNPLRIGRIKMTATQVGTAEFKGDPADISPAHDTLLFQPPDVVPFDRITFPSITLPIGRPQDVFFKAIDDNFTVEPNTATFVMNTLLKNDLPGLFGGQNGSALIITNVTPLGTFHGNLQLTSNNVVTYQPTAGFAGIDQFSYTITDTLGRTSTATVTLNVKEHSADDLMQIRLDITDQAGNPITTIQQGNKFQVRVFVKDLRPEDPRLGNPFDDRGVAAAYLDVLYNYLNVSPVLVPISQNPRGFDITYGSRYTELKRGDATFPGLLDEVGAFISTDASLPPPGPNELLLFQVGFTADTAGSVVFSIDPRDISPEHDNLIYEPPQTVPLDKVRVINPTNSLLITPGAGGEGSGNTNPVDASDINGDGNTSPIDALLIINRLNVSGAMALGRSSSSPFLDPNGDQFLSPSDALFVINVLNQRSGGFNQANGEGEAFELLTDASDESAFDSANLGSSLTIGLLESESLGVNRDDVCDSNQKPLLQSNNAAGPALLLASATIVESNSDTLFTGIAEQSTCASLDDLFQDDALFSDIATGWSKQE